MLNCLTDTAYIPLRQNLEMVSITYGTLLYFSKLLKELVIYVIECFNCGTKYKLKKVSEFCDFYYEAMAEGIGCPNCLFANGKLKQMRLFT